MRTFRDYLAAETTGYDLLIQTAHQPVIRFVGAEQAKTTTTIHEFMRGESQSDSALGKAGTPINADQYGIYYDDVAKLDGEWKFTHRLFVPVYIASGGVTGDVITQRTALLRPN